jgi:DNA-binding SARP family transcriptional activator/predicted negative regulator of RcsB-dependent stress response
MGELPASWSEVRPEMGNVEFRVLGPVEVVRDGAPVALGRGMLVDLLAALLLSVNRAVQADALTETVWHTRPPVHPRAALHNGIARLRRIVDGDVIETLPQGYRLRADADHVDLLKFDQLLAAADRAGTARDAEATMSEAIGLWRGRPLWNVESPVLLNGAVPELTARYVGACERWAELSLDMGRPDAVVARLSALAEEHPFREQLVGQLIVALYRCGRPADALAAYDTLRRALSDEMGIDPGPALQELYQKILRGDPSLMPEGPAMTGGIQLEEREPGLASPQPPPAVPAPRQLPPDLPDFCGREAETKTLTELITVTSAMPGETRVVVISGTGGVGKTALAIQVAHRLSGTFSDGQLFVDLNGGSTPRTEPDEVLASFLRALGVDGAVIPQLVQDRIAMYRSLVADRRLLIVLDNAATESQVRPLLPASASCAVIVTSRTRMTGLAGARSVQLNVLEDAHALDLLGQIIGRERAAAEAEDARALAALCGGLPLALRIAGARLAAKTHWPVAKLTGRLADTRRRLNELVHGDLDVRASFALSYQALDPAAQVMLRRASLLAAPDFPAWAGAALLDTNVAEAEDICERLVDAQLLDAGSRLRSGEIRYRLHDLVRAFARELAVDGEPATTRMAALARAFGGWLALAQRAHRQVYGGDFTILHGTAPRWTGCGRAVQQAIDDDPIGWLEGERRAVAAAVHQSAELGLDELSWDLAWTVTTLYETRAYFDDWLAVQKSALAATERAGNRRGRAAMLTARSSCMLQIGRLEESRELAEESLRLFAEAGDPHGCAIAQYRLAVLYVRSGQAEAAVAVCQQAIDNSQLAGDVFLEASVLRELAGGHIERGDHEVARDHLTRSLRLLERNGNQRGRSMTRHVLGELQLRQGDYGAAEATFRQVLADVRAASDIVGQAHVLLGLGETLANAGRSQEAGQRLDTALTLARQARQRIVEARVLFVLGSFNPAQRSRPVLRDYLTQSLAIFDEVDLAHWRQRAFSALGSLDDPGPSAPLLTQRRLRAGLASCRRSIR